MKLQPWIAAVLVTMGVASCAPDAPPDEAPRLSLLPFANLASWPIWQYLAIAAFALFALEWWLFHRRRTE